MHQQLTDQQDRNRTFKNQVEKVARALNAIVSDPASWLGHTGDPAVAAKPLGDHSGI